MLIVAASTARAQTTVSFAPSKDNTLYEDSTGRFSNGQGTLLFIGKTDSNDGFHLRRTLVAFDLSSIPTNATVTQATLTMFLSRSSSGAVTVPLRKVLKDWGEGASNGTGGGAPAQTGDATWLHTFFNTALWSTPGGDFSGTNSATTSVNNTGTTYSWTGSGMVADVQSWVANGASNFGWAVLGDEANAGSAKAFSSGEAGTGRPQLTVTYTTPAPSAPPQLLNISTRLRVETGENALIGGFIITGNTSKKVILRAIGPSLSPGVADALANPVLELRGGDGAVLMTNDNWKETQQTEIQNSGVAPQNDLESAIVATLPPAGYTAIVRGKDDTTGVGLVEAYDLAQAADARLANISTRGRVQTGANVMIGGFIMGGDSNAKVILRAIGPSLSGSVANPLADPTLEFFDANGARVAQNDDWKDDPNQAAEISASGIAPQNDRESALVATIAPAPYTAVVAGKNGGTGVAVVEVYHIR